MSVKVSKRLRNAGIKAAKKQAVQIADEQIRELFNASLKIRLQFAIKLIFKR
jgi:hypothetical protein